MLMPKHLDELTFGKYLKTIRKSNGISMRSYATSIGLDSGNFSKIENGKLAPPTTQSKIKHLIRKLNLDNKSLNDLYILAYKELSENWYKSFWNLR